MKKAVLFALFLIYSTIASAQWGYYYPPFLYLRGYATADAPGVSPSGLAYLYYNTTDSKLYVSMAGAAYTQITTGAPGISIGGAVTGGTATRVLFEGAGPVLADDAGLTYNGTTDTLTLLGSVAAPFFVDQSADPADSGVLRVGNAVNVFCAEASPAANDSCLQLGTNEQWLWRGASGADMYSLSAGSTYQTGNICADGNSVTCAQGADVGRIRLANGDAIAWEASPAGTDGYIDFNSSEQFELAPNGTPQLTLDPTAATFVPPLIVPSETLTNATGADIVVNGSFSGSATGWTEGSGWAWAGDAEPHSSNGTATLTPSTPLVLTVGQMYLLTYTVSGWSVGTVTASAGGVTLQAAGANGTYTAYFTASATTTLAFTPTNTARFTLDDVSLVPVTQEITSTTGPVTITKSLTNAVSDQAAMRLDYTVNKATAGNDTGLVINQTDVASPGTSNALEIKTGNASQLTISAIGNLGFTNAVALTTASASGFTFNIGSSALAAIITGVKVGSGRSIGFTDNTNANSGTLDAYFTRSAKGSILLNGSATIGSGISSGLTALTDNTPTIVSKVTMTSNSIAGGRLQGTVEDTTTLGAIAFDVLYEAVDSAGTITCTVGTVNSVTALGGGAGFVLTGVTCSDAGSNVLNLLVNAKTTGGTDVLQAKTTVIQNNTQTVTPQ